MRNKKKNKYMLLLILLLGITLGYAAISTTLKITGQATVTKQTWDVYWGVPTVTEGSVTTTAPTRTEDSGDPANTKLTWNITLDLPGDYYEFTVDAVNNGTVDAMITGLTPSVSPALPTNPEYIKYEVTYADGEIPEENHLLPKKEGNTPTTETYKVRVYYDETVATRDTINNMTASTTYTFNLELTYGQATDEAYQRPTTLQNDDWNTIVTNVRKDKSVYPVGATKTIEMDLDGDNTPETYTLRVANNTTPAECSTQGFSQTACGFVLEFQDIITTHRINEYGDGKIAGTSANGGWEYSDMRAYLNSTTYSYENIDYSTTGIYNKLPQDLQSVIIDTSVVSGYGYNDRTHGNFETTDKLYLLDSKEIYGVTFTEQNNTAKDNERQLDYYESQGVSMERGTYAPALKKQNGTANNWFLRSAVSDFNWFFWDVNSAGGCGQESAQYEQGVSPAFRIAE